ncbi:MAG: hypothetical protein Kow0079_01350 [Vicingaceae bacterium]
MKKFAILNVLIAVILCSCTHNKKEIGEVTSLEQLLTDTEELLHSVDTTKVFPVAKSIEKDLKYIQLNYKDTMDKSLAIKLNTYHSNRKALLYFVRNYKTFLEEIAFSKKQLTDLKEDLKNNTLDMTKYPDYYKNEQTAIVNLNNNISRAVEGVNVTLPNIDKVKPTIDSLLNVLKNNSGV